MPWAASLALCCQGAEAPMPVAETKAPALGQALGEWAAGAAHRRGACVLENKGIVPWGEAGGPWQPPLATARDVGGCGWQFLRVA